VSDLAPTSSSICSSDLPRVEVDDRVDPRELLDDGQRYADDQQRPQPPADHLAQRCAALLTHHVLNGVQLGLHVALGPGALEHRSRFLLIRSVR
jgi:hypothetical protein